MIRDTGFATRRDAVRAAIVVTVAATALASTLSTLSVFWVPRAGLGIAVSGTTITGVAPNSSAKQGGIRPGDRLDPTYGFADRARILWYDDYAPGEQVALRIVRDGRIRTVQIVTAQEQQPLSPLTEALMALRLLTYVVFIVVGATLVLLKPARFSWGFFLCCLGLATMPGLIGRATSIVDASLGFVLYGIWLVVADLANVGFLAFALRFPNDEALSWRRFAWRSLPVWFVVFAGIDAWYMIAWYSGADLPRWIQTASWAMGIAAWAVSTLSLSLTLRDADQRNRRRLLWAIVGASVGYLSWYVGGLLHAAGYDVAGQIVGFGTLALPISVGYAVIKHRVVDVRFAINRALILSIVGTCVIGALALTYWATTALLQKSHLTIFVQVAIALLVGVSLHRLYVFIKNAGKSLMIGDIQRVRRILTRASHALAAVESYEALESIIAREPADALELEFAAVYRRGQDGTYECTFGCGAYTVAPKELKGDEPLIVLAKPDRQPLQSRLVREHGASLAVPIHDGAVMRALVLFGHHRNGFDVDADEVQAITALMRPAEDAYRHLNRLAQQVRILALAVRDWDREQIMHYLVDQILASLPPDERKVLLACAALPDAGDAELTLAAQLEDDGDRAAALARRSPFVERNDVGRFFVRPALREPLRARLPERGNASIVACALSAVARRDYERGAELYMAAGCRADALSALERLHQSHVEQPTYVLPPGQRQTIESAPVETLFAYPALLTLRLQQRCPLGDDAELRAVASQSLQTLEPGRIRFTLAAWLVYAHSECGDHARAAHTLSRELEPNVYAHDASHAVMARIAMGLVLAKLGRLEDAASMFDQSRPLGALMRASFVERARGNVVDSRVLFRSGFDRETKPWAPICTAALADELIGEWLAGSDARCVHIASILAEADAANTPPAFGHLICNARGGTQEPPENAHPRHAAYSYLMCAANATHHDSAVRFARCSLERAVAAGEPLIEAHVLLSCSELEPLTHMDDLARAVDRVAEFDSAPLKDALTACVRDEEAGGMFAPLIARMRLPRVGQPEPLTISLVTGTTRRGRNPIALAEGELALLLALARDPWPQSVPELIDVLWPDHDEQSAVRSLQSRVHRLRARLGDPSVVENLAQGYRLRAGVLVDLWQAEYLLRQLSAVQTLHPSAVSQLDALRHTFGIKRPMPLAMWEWFGSIDARIVAVARTSRLRLAEHWLRTGDHRSALACARELIAADDLDEAGWELSIRAHLGAGSVSEGQRDFRFYRELLARELAVEPSPSIAALVSLERNGHAS
jgi:DNA-binding SARP family transcriptional activator